MRERFDSETRLSWVLAGLAGLVGALAFTHSAGYYVTFMTGNTERAALGYFRAQPWLAMTATLLLAAFVGGVVVASLCRRHLWVAHPHGPTVLTALSLGAATTVCIATHGWSAAGDLSFVPIPFVAFGNWRPQYFICQRRRGINPTELCDRHDGEDGAGH